jgi:uncharacterized protein YciI
VSGGGERVLYIIYQEDRDDGAEIRAANKDEHFAYLDRHQDILLLGGALLDDDGSSAPEAVSSSTCQAVSRRRNFRATNHSARPACSRA